MNLFCECKNLLSIMTYNINNVNRIDNVEDFIKIINVEKLYPLIYPTFNKKVLQDYIKSNNLESNIISIYDEYQNSNLYYLNCSNCDSKYLLKTGIINSKNINYKERKIVLNDIKSIVNDKTLFRTKNFICNTTNCKGDVATLYRPYTDSKEFIYICNTCFKYN